MFAEQSEIQHLLSLLKDIQKQLFQYGRNRLRLGRPKQIHFFHLLAAHPGMTQLELGEHFDLQPSALKQILRHLATAGLIELEPDSRNSQLVHVMLTARGEQLANDGWRFYPEALRKITRHMTHYELHALIEAAAAADHLLQRTNALTPQPFSRLHRRMHNGDEL
ncbi:MarR family winged helix-turn-helix transcriptional regulator [Lactobacillus selangorensis]|nr:MarR family transcriptional regulator [Lactobacillus selangorensis]